MAINAQKQNSVVTLVAFSVELFHQVYKVTEENLKSVTQESALREDSQPKPPKYEANPNDYFTNLDVILNNHKVSLGRRTQFQSPC